MTRGSKKRLSGITLGTYLLLVVVGVSAFCLAWGNRLVSDYFAEKQILRQGELPTDNTRRVEKTSQSYVGKEGYTVGGQVSENEPLSYQIKVRVPGYDDFVNTTPDDSGFWALNLDQLVTEISQGERKQWPGLVYVEFSNKNGDKVSKVVEVEPGYRTEVKTPKAPR